MNDYYGVEQREQFVHNAWQQRSEKIVQNVER